MNERIIIVGGPRRGKSTLAHKLAAPSPAFDQGRPAFPIRCGDPLSKVKDPQMGVQYLPEGIPISGDDGAAQWVADNWFKLKGPWVCEGWVMARALRRWLGTHEEWCNVRDVRKPRGNPCDRIIVLSGPAWVDASKGQEAMHKAVMTVWSQVAHHFTGITEERYR